LDASLWRNQGRWSFFFVLYSLVSFVLRLERSQIEHGVFALVSFVVRAGWWWWWVGILIGMCLEKGEWFLYLRLYGTDQGMNGRTDGGMEV
jgi:hypothetical protein